jgi:hypothetical protein
MEYNHRPLVAHIVYTSNPHWKGRVVNLLIWDNGNERQFPGLTTFSTYSNYVSKDQLRRHHKIKKFLKRLRQINKNRGHSVQCVFWDEQNN